MKRRFDYEVVVIGSGSAGYAAACTAAGLGARTAIVEAGPRIAGLCILKGCMPSKALLASSNRMRAIATAHQLGIRSARAMPDMRRILSRKDKLVDEFETYRNHQLRTGDFDLIRGRARFLDAHTIRLENGRRITGKNFIVCTGSKISAVEVEGLRETGFVDSDAAMEIKRLPKSLIVLGGGPVALELGQYFSRLGVRVTMLQRSPQLLSKFDPDVAQSLRESLEGEGMAIQTGVKLLRAEKTRRKKSILFLQDGRKRRVEADEILYALGRVPNTEGLGLEEIGVKLCGCAVKIDDAMRSSLRHIFAAGDVAGRYEIVHIAIQQAEIAARNAVAGKNEKWDGRARTFVVFTDPQLAVTGPSERDLEGKKYLSAKFPFADLGKAMVLAETEGFGKIITDARGKILGAQVVGFAGAELIHQMVAFIHLGASVADLAAMPHYHPTLAEIWTYPAEEILGKLRR